MLNTDKIIKGLSAHGYKDCSSCPYWGTGENGLSACDQLARDALELIDEQRIEIAERRKMVAELLKEEEQMDKLTVNEIYGLLRNALSCYEDDSEDRYDYERADGFYQDISAIVNMLEPIDTCSDK